MTKPFWVITGEGGYSPSLLSGELRWEVAQWAKGITYGLCFLFYFASSLAQKEFLDVQVSSHIFAWGALVLSFHLIAIHGGPKSNSLKASYFFDGLLLAVFCLLTSGAQSLFLIFGAFNILLAGFVFGMAFAFQIAIFSAACMNFAFLGVLPWGPVMLKSLLVFDGTFVVVAALAGLLAEELLSVANLAETQAEDIKSLQNLNDLILDNMSSGVLALDLNGVIVKSNRSASKILEDLGLNQKRLEDVFPGLQHEIHQLDSVETLDWRHKTTDGNTSLLEFTLSPVRARQNSVGSILLFREVTEIRNLEARVRQTEKLAAVGQLAAGIAHEIRNPLASISGSVQLLASTLQLTTAEDKKLLSIMIKEIDRLNDLISEFMDYVRPDLMTDEPVQLANLVGEILDMVAVNDRLPTGVQAIRNFRPVHDIRGNAAKLKQAILNMVINSYQAMEKSFMKKIEITLYEENEKVVLEIQDSGVGISPENLHRIFEPFHSTKPKGTGLGLAIAQKVFEAHHAEVEVKSVLGVGTTFRIEFPFDSR